MTPHQFIDWFEREEIDTDWLPLFIDVIVGKPASRQVDFIPVQVVEYAAQSIAISPMSGAMNETKCLRQPKAKSESCFAYEPNAIAHEISRAMKALPGSGDL